MMKRLHLFEFHELDWFPRAIRDAMTDYLQFVSSKTKPYAAIVPILASALQRTGARQVLDLCSGAGGPWVWLHGQLAQQGLNVTIRLTDKYPNADALTPSGSENLQAIRYHPHSVDATRVEDALAGFRTLFSSFHHFRPDQARAMLSDAVAKGEGIAIFEGTHNSVGGWLVMFLVPLMVLLTTPFIRPFKWSRLFWTYLIPLLPLLVWFDGLVSSLRTYSIPQLRALTEGLETKTYQWEIGQVKCTAGPLPITYLVGFPVTAGTEAPTYGQSPN